MFFSFRGDALTKMERKKTGQPKMNAGTFHKKLSEMKKKIKQANLEAGQVEQGREGYSVLQRCS